MGRIEYLKDHGWVIRKTAVKGHIRAQYICFRTCRNFYRSDLLQEAPFTVDEAWRVQMIEEQKPYEWRPE